MRRPSRSPIQIPNPNTKAEGAIWLKGEDPIPYDTELAGPDGVNIHFWIGDRPLNNETKDIISRAGKLARAHRDVVSISYSKGEPEGYWAGMHIYAEGTDP